MKGKRKDRETEGGCVCGEQAFQLLCGSSGDILGIDHIEENGGGKGFETFRLHFL